MNKYEIVFIVKAEVEENVFKETVKEFENVLTGLKAKIDNSRSLGQKKLAYEIKGSVRGYYQLLNVTANAEAIKEFDRKARLNDKILRHLIIKEEN